jgi:hypothetical protein
MCIFTTALFFAHLDLQEGCVDILHNGVWQYTVTAPELLGVSAVLAVADVNPAVAGSELRNGRKQRQQQLKQQEVQGERRGEVGAAAGDGEGEERGSASREGGGDDYHRKEGGGVGTTGDLNESDDLLKGMAEGEEEKSRRSRMGLSGGRQQGGVAAGDAGRSRFYEKDVVSPSAGSAGNWEGRDAAQDVGELQAHQGSRDQGSKQALPEAPLDSSKGRGIDDHEAGEEDVSGDEKASGGIDNGGNMQQHRFRPYTLRCRTAVRVWHLPMLGLEAFVIRFPELKENLLEVWRARRTEDVKVVE